MSRARPLWVLIGLVAAAMALLPAADRIDQRDEAPVRPVPPDRLGVWQGVPVSYCHAAGCQREYHGAAAGGTCTNCGGPLYSLSALEAALLPRDTTLHKTIYRAPDQPLLTVSIVISSRERSSIHRPEVCLVGQGTDLAGRFTHTVPRPGGRPLEVTVLELMRNVRRPDGTVASTPAYYAYWFVGTRGRETASHGRRMVWMAWDRIVRGEASRWAYVAVGGPRPPEGRDYVAAIDAFVAPLAGALAP